MKKKYKVALNLLVEANSKIPYSSLPELERNQLQGFLEKLFLQANTAILISKGTPIKLENMEKGEIDKVSMLTLARSVLETYAQFFHIFVAPQNGDVKNFRLLMSEYWGLQNRKNIKPNNKPLRTKVISDTAKRKQLLMEIYNTQHYTCLKANIIDPQKLKNFEKDIRSGRFEEFMKTDLLIKAGISDKTARNLYHYFSDFIHSGSLSRKQIRPTSTYQTVDQSVASILDLFFIPVIFTVKGLSKTFPKVNEMSEAKSGEMEAIDNYIAEFNKIFEFKPYIIPLFLRRKPKNKA